QCGHQPIKRHDPDDAPPKKSGGGVRHPEIVVTRNSHDEAADQEEYLDPVSSQRLGDISQMIVRQSIGVGQLQEMQDRMIGHHEQRGDASQALYGIYFSDAGHCVPVETESPRANSMYSTSARG